ncbi:hypothetical protein [Salipiger sp.]|uniref:hypothetical protein n=1 Tax=Salipiger sp. TaxID=2078585 RepID=UPI003A97CE51|tara:strand:- start:30 stop:227 length:198 start_codon:yes stop_codon:yes gene_type:complete
MPILIIVAWLNLILGLIGAAVAFMNSALPLAIGMAIAALTVFAALKGIEKIIQILDDIRYHTRQK